MLITETRINLVGLECPGCDCGACVREAVEEIGQLPGVDHVRMDRRRAQVVIRHGPRDSASDQFAEVIRSKGIELLG